ncbi:MAG: SMI1/KNR4 family protein [Chloroflexota bacterium]
MSNYKFLQEYIQSIPEYERRHYIHGYLNSGFILQNGISAFELDRLQFEYGFSLPKELEDFYRFSYGALLNEIEIFTIPEIEKSINSLKPMDDLGRLENLIPFANLRGSGDTFAFDVTQEVDGYFLILDGFHEYPLGQWNGICFGFHNWLTKLVENKFHPFWIV